MFEFSTPHLDPQLPTSDFRHALSRMGGLPEAWLLDDTRLAAQRLIGAVLIVRDACGALAGGRIVETEAYLRRDPASHSYRGVTPRVVPMFGPAGSVYVYRAYGVHWCLNVVTRASGCGEAVLIRAVDPLFGLDQMRRRRGDLPVHRLAQGPGNVARALGVSAEDNGVSVLVSDRIAVGYDHGHQTSARNIIATRRVGITKNPTPFWRYCLRGNSAVSRGPGPLRNTHKGKKSV